MQAAAFLKCDGVHVCVHLINLSSDIKQTGFDDLLGASAELIERRAAFAVTLGIVTPSRLNVCKAFMA